MPRPDQSRADLSPVLVDVIRAAAHAARHDSRANRRGEAEALAQLGRLARLAVPARGVLAPVDDDLYHDIHRVARDHLGYGTASRRLRAGLARVGTFENRDAIETAHAAVVNATSVTYYYAGLAFGVALGELSRTR